MGNTKKNLKKAIIIGSIIPIFLYVLFAIGIIGVLGIHTHEIGALGLASILGEKMLFIGGLFALFTLTTSFLAVGLALKELFWYDYGLKKNTSWILACFVPFLLFLLVRDFASFATVLNITGIIAGSIVSVLIILMTLNAKKMGDRKPEYSIYINKFIAFILVILFVAGAVNLLI